MKYLLSSLVILVILDGILTQVLINGKNVREVNPLLQSIVGDYGFIALKVLGALICAFILWDVYKRYPRIGLAFTGCCVVFYGGIVLWNSSLFLLI